jgi:hypothetical protein
LLLVFGFKNCEIVLLHLKAILTLVYLKRFVIFLICGDTYVKVVHLMLILDFVSVVILVILCCICCLNLIRMFLGKLLLCAIFSMVIHSLCWCFFFC